MKDNDLGVIFPSQPKRAWRQRLAAAVIVLASVGLGATLVRSPFSIRTEGGQGDPLPGLAIALDKTQPTDIRLLALRRLHHDARDALETFRKLSDDPDSKVAKTAQSYVRSTVRPR